MDRTKAAELLTKALGCVQTDLRNCGECKKCENYATKEDGIEAIRMAIDALEKAPTALDHIHNVVSEREYQRGYEDGKRDSIPIEWIENKMKWLREHNGAFYDPAYFLEMMLEEWKDEQSETEQ